MTTLSLCEYQWVRSCGNDCKPHEDERGIRLPQVLYDQLRRWDEVNASGREGLTLFHWLHNRAVARQYVGVIQLGSVTLEILPKTASSSLNTPLSDDDRNLERSNLIEMLRGAGLVSFRDRGVAPQSIRRLPLFEAILFIFASAMLAELRLGSPRAYVRREENLFHWKGKLHAARQASRNLLHPERFYVRYTEFSPETPLTRVLRTGVKLAREFSTLSKTHRVLDNCIPWLGGLENTLQSPDKVIVPFTRQNDHFKPVHDFSLQLLRQVLNAPVSGGARIFSLLFDMNKVFEGYVTQLYRDVVPEDWRVVAQGKGQGEYLVYEDPQAKKGGKKHLKPDILFRGTSNGQTKKPLAVLDTKWKIVNPSEEAMADQYQLYAYASQFGSERNVLLYPSREPVNPSTFHLHPHLLDGVASQSITLARLNIARNLTNPEVKRKISEELYDLIVYGHLGKAYDKLA